MAAPLKIARGVKLPLELASEAIAILAKRGAGKTHTGAVLVEEIYAAGVQVVILDPVGAWWGLRSSADGKSEGLPIAVLGGEHGDVTLEQTAGALIADVAVDSGQSLVLDLSDFPSKAAVARFATDFAERLYRRKARSRSLLHLVLEEADEFAPQKPYKGQERALGAIEQIVRRGRSRGLGVTMITQRSAVLNKDVLTQTDMLIVLRTTGPQDQDAIKLWIRSRADSGEDVLDTLSSLATGEAWFWNPERELLERAKVRPRRTYDSSATPKAGERKIEPTRVAPIDLAKLGEQIQATAERAKENDPAELHRQIAALQRELQQRPREGEPRVETVTVEIPVVPDEALQGLATIVKRGETLTKDLGTFAGEISTSLASIEQEIAQVRAVAQESKTAKAVSRRADPPPPPPPPRPARPTRLERVGDVDEISGPQQRVLNAIAWWEQIGFPQPSKLQVAFISRYRVGRRVGGTFGNILGQLKSTGLIDYPTAGVVQLTQEGAAIAHPPAVDATPYGLQQEVYSQLAGPERRVLETIIDVYPEPLTKQEAGERSGYTVGDRVGGTFGNILGRLRTLGLIDYPAPGLVKAEPVLFLEGANA